MKITPNLMFLLLVFVALDGFCQNLPSLGRQKEAMIFYTTTVTFSGNQMVWSDSLFVRNSLVLELIKTDFVHDYTNLQTGKTNSTSEKRLDWYYITDVSRGVGMGFNVKKEPIEKNIKTFTAKSKDLGYGMIAEPFLPKDGYSVKDFAKVRDTLINGQKCFVILANRKVPVTYNGIMDELLFTKMVINPKIIGQNYPFISELLTKSFGGAIVFAQSQYKSGVKFSMKLDYKQELTAAYSVIFDKYWGLYLSNIVLVDKL
ncbi:MAG: hypothetical protein WKF66_02305 [Pedobacter sp.]